MKRRERMDIFLRRARLRKTGWKPIVPIYRDTVVTVHQNGYRILQNLRVGSVASRRRRAPRSA